MVLAPSTVGQDHVRTSFQPAVSDRTISFRTIAQGAASLSRSLRAHRHQARDAVQDCRPSAEPCSRSRFAGRRRLEPAQGRGRVQAMVFARGKSVTTSRKSTILQPR